MFNFIRICLRTIASVSDFMFSTACIPMKSSSAWKLLSTYLIQSTSCSLLLLSVASLAIIEKKTLPLMFLVIFLRIVDAINLRISFCESLCKYLLLFFSIQLVILGSIFELSFISWSNFPWSSFLWNVSPFLARHSIF